MILIKNTSNIIFTLLFSISILFSLKSYAEFFKDISHILPTSTHPELQNDPDNWFPEDISENRSRNQLGEIPSQSEVTNAYFDNEMDVIDQDYDDDGIIDTETEINLENLN